MGIVKKITMVGLAAAMALAVTMPSAEARNRRHGALVGGLIAGAVLGAVIAGAANADDGYDEYPRYRRQPAYSYGYGYGNDDGYQYAAQPYYYRQKVYRPRYQPRYQQTWDNPYYAPRNHYRPKVYNRRPAYGDRNGYGGLSNCGAPGVGTMNGLPLGQGGRC